MQFFPFPGSYPMLGLRPLEWGRTEWVMGGGRIVIASPCDAERRLLGHLLAGDELKVVEVSSGKEVIEQAEAGGVSLIILDTLFWQTPALNTLHAIKAREKTRDTPVMLFGQPSARDEVTGAVKAGAATWVTRKGFQIELFIEKVRELMLMGPRPPRETGWPLRIRRSIEQPLSPQFVQQVLDEVQDLAAFDFTISETLTSTCSKDRVVDHIAHIAGRDPMLTIALLHRAGGKGHAELADGTSDVRETVKLIGERDFHRLVESLPSLRFDDACLWDPGHFWLHSVAVSRLSGLFSRMLGMGRPAEALNAGLLHDIGYYVLAQRFPRHFIALFNGAFSQASVTAEWETRTIGLHHGAVGALAIRRFGLAESLQDAAFAHDLEAGVFQSLKPSSRVLTMLVQAADQMAVALFPGDPWLTPLTPISQEFEAALDSAGVRPSELLEKSREIVADLVTELRWLFPQTETRPHHYLEPPIKRAIYFAPGKRHVDVVKLFIQTRCDELLTLRTRREAAGAGDAPMVLNLMYVPDPSARLEVVTSLMATGLFKDRRSVVLLDSVPKESLMGLLPRTCRVLPPRSQPAKWMRWLAGCDARPGQIEPANSVA